MQDNNDTQTVGMSNIFTSFSGTQKNVRTEVKSNPINCLFFLKIQWPRLNQLSTHRCLCTLLSCYRVISLTHRTSGWPETHSSMCTESFLRSIQMPPHSRHSHIFKRAFAHLMMHDSFSVLFMPTDCVWRWSRIGRPGKSDCVKLLLTGKWGVLGGWGCKGLRLIKSGATDGWREAALGIAVTVS